MSWSCKTHQLPLLPPLTAASKLPTKYKITLASQLFHQKPFEKGINASHLYMAVENFDMN